jgi:hypothetical protein
VVIANDLVLEPELSWAQTFFRPCSVETGDPVAQHRRMPREVSTVDLVEDGQQAVELAHPLVAGAGFEPT